jgi:hypothetical protein
MMLTYWIAAAAVIFCGVFVLLAMALAHAKRDVEIRITLFEVRL